MKIEKPKVKLIGANANAFNLLGLCKESARLAGWSLKEWEKVRDRAMKGDYNHLLSVLGEHFVVT